MYSGMQFEWQVETNIALLHMKNILLIVVLSLSTGLMGQAQQVWTLEDCIAYAIDNNIALKRQAIQTQQSKTNLLATKAQVLPSLNLTGQAEMNFGRSVDPVTNTITFNQNLTNFYYLYSGVTIFNGFATANRISASKFLLDMGIELEKVQIDLLTIDIINSYYEVLMYRGMIETAKSQLDVSDQQLHRISVMVETGSESRTTKLELQSQVSRDRLLLTQATNNQIIALESLKQLLQLEQGREFDINENSLLVEISEDLSTDVDSIFEVAKSILPRVSALKYQNEARKRLVKAAIGDATPILSLNAGWTTGYYDAMTEGVTTTPFSDQLNNNNNQSVQAVLRVPIFNRWTQGSNIKRAKLNLQDSELQLQQELNTLYAQVNNATLELAAVKDEHNAIMDTKDYSDLAFTAIEKKFQTGMANATEYAEARRQKFYSEIDLLRVQLQYNLKLLTLKYYLTGRWTNN